MLRAETPAKTTLAAQAQELTHPHVLLAQAAMAVVLRVVTARLVALILAETLMVAQAALLATADLAQAALEATVLQAALAAKAARAVL